MLQRGYFFTANGFPGGGGLFFLLAGAAGFGLFRCGFLMV
jgi:hypothetical protein